MSGQIRGKTKAKNCQMALEDAPMIAWSAMAGLSPASMQIGVAPGRIIHDWCIRRGLTTIVVICCKS